MAKATGLKDGTYKLSRCVGPPGGMPNKARMGGSSLRALPAGSSPATLVCGIFAGLAPDLFAADRTAATAYRAAVAAGKFSPDFFHTSATELQNRNVTAIVIEVPRESIGGPEAAVRRGPRCRCAGARPNAVSRWGLPLMTHVFITDEGVKDDYNRSLPSADVPRSLGSWRQASRASPSWPARPTTRVPSLSESWRFCSRPLCLMSSTRRPRSVSQASMVAL